MAVPVNVQGERARVRLAQDDKPSARALVTKTASKAWVRLQPVWPSLVTYYAIQTVGVVVLGVMSARVGLSLPDVLGSWDSDWFMHIAQHGYDQPVVLDAAGQPRENSLPFFPLYPALTAILLAVGLPPLWAGLLVTLLAGGAAAVGLFVLGRELASARVGLLLVAFFAMAPGSVVLHMAYSEAVFIALAVWALVAMLRKHWLLAGVLILFAGLARSTGVALLVAFVLAVVVAMIRDRATRRHWRTWIGLAVAPMGLLGFLGFVGFRTGRPDGYFWLQESVWKLHFDGGVFTWDRLVGGLTTNLSPWTTLVGLVVIGAAVLLLWSFLSGLPWVLHIYSVVVLITALGVNEYWQCRPRFLLPAVTLAIPLAMLTAKIPNRVLAVLLPVGALAGGWLGAFLLTVAQLNP